MGNVSAAGESWTVVNYIITESYSTSTKHPRQKHATTSNISREAFNVLFRFQNGPNDSCSPKNCKLIPWYFIETTFFQQEFRLLRSTFHPGLWLAICGIYRRYEYIKQPIDIPSYIEVLDNEKHCINCMDVMSWSFMDQQKHTSFNSHDMNPPTSPSCSDEHSAGNHRQTNLQHKWPLCDTVLRGFSPIHWTWAPVTNMKFYRGFPTKTEI